MVENPTPAQSFRGKLNIYTCDTCRGHIVTIDMDAGTTPFMIACHAVQEGEGQCKGRMTSSMYRVFDQSMRPDYEWYRPTGYVIPNLRDHVNRGGLLMRKHEARK